ncbi:MAG: 1-acyl-sn-glycerol-3-phosphate acyltransferase [Thermoleophilaceae bacterium]
MIGETEMAANGSGGPGRSQHGGVRGIIERRTGAWSVEPADERFVALQAPFWNFLLDRYFRMEMAGWHRLPEPPALLIGVHASGILPIDAYAFGFQWMRHFGPERPINGTAHDFLMATPGIGDYLRRIGTVPAGREAVMAALVAGHDVVVYPGGDLDSLRPWTKRDKVVLAGRTGFVRQAIRAQVPIVPVATIGGPDTLPVITDGRRLAKLLRLDKLARSEVFPLAVGFPFGIAPGMIPQIPLPAKIRTEILEPIDTGVDASLEENDDFVDEKYREVERALQDGVDRLAKRRRFPIFG